MSHLPNEKCVRKETYICKRDVHTRKGTCIYEKTTQSETFSLSFHRFSERWGAGVETQQNVRGEIGGWGRVPFNEPYAPLLSTIYDGA